MKAAIKQLEKVIEELHKIQMATLKLIEKESKRKSNKDKNNNEQSQQNKQV